MVFGMLSTIWEYPSYVEVFSYSRLQDHSDLPLMWTQWIVTKERIPWSCCAITKHFCCAIEKHSAFQCCWDDILIVSEDMYVTSKITPQNSFSEDFHFYCSIILLYFTLFMTKVSNRESCRHLTESRKHQCRCQTIFCDTVGSKGINKHRTMPFTKNSLMDISSLDGCTFLKTRLVCYVFKFMYTAWPHFTRTIDATS